jgi:hypothetical protein
MDEKENQNPQAEGDTIQATNTEGTEQASVDNPTSLPSTPEETMPIDTVAESTQTETAPSSTRNRSLYFFAGVAVVILALAGVAYVQFAPKADVAPDTLDGELTAEQADEPVAYVNGVAITRGVLAESVSQLSEGALQSGMDVNDLVVKAQIESQAYEISINNELLRQAATAAVEKPTDAVVQQEVDTIIAQNGGEAAFTELLKQYNLTLETLKKNIADNLHIQAYLDTKITPVEVSDADVQAFYDSLGGEEAGIPPLEEVKQQVIAEIQNQKEQEQIGTIIEQLKAEAKIENV